MKANQTTLKIYRELQNQHGNAWQIASNMLIYNSVDAFVDEPTDEEYGVIADACYRAYMKADSVDLIRLADKVSEEYSLGNITLDYLREVSPYKLRTIRKRLKQGGTPWKEPYSFRRVF